MTVSVIIICCLWFFILILLRIVKRLYNGLKEIENTEEEMAFFQGDIDIPKEKIANKYEDAILFCRVEKNNIDNDTWKVFDVSNYSKNRVIGLTFFVQEQMFNDLKGELYSPEFYEEVKREIIKHHGLNPEEDDKEFFNALLNSAIKEVLEEESYCNSASIITHCTVYQLKDGRWLWRPEKGD